VSGPARYGRRAHLLIICALGLATIRARPRGGDMTVAERKVSNKAARLAVVG